MPFYKLFRKQGIHAMIKNRSIGTKVTLCMIPLIALSFFSNTLTFHLHLPLFIAQLMSFVLLAVVLIACIFLNHFLITKRLKKTVSMVQELSKNHMDARLEVSSKDEVGCLSEALNELADNIQKNILGVMKKISQGDLEITVETDDALDKVAPVINDTVAAIGSLSNDTKEILVSAKNGDLTKRCRASSYSGVWGQLAQEINAVLDSVTEPMSEVGAVMERLAVNDYTKTVKGSYDGDFKCLADRTNEVCGRLESIQNAMIQISKGDTSALEQARKTGKRSENDNMVPTIIKMSQTIEDLISEVKTFTKESADGNISGARGDTGKFEGGFRDIIEGLNSTLDSIAGPLSDFTAVLKSMEVNDFTSKLNEDYKGDFKIMRDAMENVTSRLLSAQNVAEKISRGDISELEAFRKIGKRSENDRLVPAFTLMMESIQQLIDETGAIAHAVTDGNFDYQIHTDHYEGRYRDIIAAFENAFDEIKIPMKEVTGVMGSLSGGVLGVEVKGNYSGEFKILKQAVNLTASKLHTVVQKISETLIQLSAGNLNVNRLDAFHGDFAGISDALNTIIGSLNELLGNINETAEQVAAGSLQVSQGSQSLSTGTTEQASAVEELTASVTEIAERTKHNAENAARAENLVDRVKENASSGSGQMDEMLGSIHDIGEASANISKIIKVIDDIAFQTNILSLNAAVEAARAGEYGRGFAVVAEEVRNLAAKSAEAAKETAELIESTVSKVNSGTHIAGKTAEAFGSIVSGVNQVSGIVNEFALSSNDQATGIAQIEKGLSQVSMVVQTNSATSEESAAASEELSGQAELLKEQVSKFVLRNSR